MLISKRSFLIASGQLAALGASTLLLPRSAQAGAPLPWTPPTDLGPFYPLETPLDSDFDLTRIQGKNGRASGEVVEVSGRILTTDGTPQPNARIEIWQANAVGRYAHPNDRRTDVPLDPHFQGYADLRADAQGNFRFLTVKPGMYPAGSFQRAPHIHFDIRGRRQRLVTQMYFPADEALLKQDKVLMHDLWGKASPMPANVFGQLQAGGAKAQAGAAHYRFDIVLFDGVLG
jgi:protocatechuate 3,4-dioxygenase beta subunit